MRQRIFTLFLVAAVALVSCRKDHVDVDIKTYDQNQIQNYINVFGLTGMKRDMTDGDTTGIYYQTIMPGDVTSTPIDYADNVSFVFTVRSMDGKYTSSDTITNHLESYLGHVTTLALPYGLQLAMHNLLKYKGSSARILIPSHLAYGANGYKTAGSSTVVNANIAGNQCLDYYVHIIDNYTTYDEQVIHNRVSDLSTYTRQESDALPGNFYYYKILTPGTGTDALSLSSAYVVTDTGQLLNGTIFDDHNGDVNTLTGTVSSFGPSALREGFVKFVKAGTKISFIIPSKLGYDNTTSGSIPSNSVLRFTFQVVSVTQ